MHPEHALIALLLPGMVLCGLMLLEWRKTGRKPHIRLFGWMFPIPLVYLVVLVGGPMWLVMLLIQSIQRKS